jgi:hypothetical protein
MLATVIAAALPFSALAQGSAANYGSPLNGKTGSLKWKNQVVQGVEGVQVVEPFALDSLPNAYSFFINNSQPLQYDPISNTLVVIKRGNPEQSGNNFYIRRSQDLGATWSTAIGPLHDNSTGLSRYPSVHIINPTGSETNPDELIYAYSAPLVSNVTGVFGPVVSGLLVGSDAIPEVNEGVNIGGENFTWSTDSKIASTPDGQTILIVSKISPPDGSGDLSATNNFALRRNVGFGSWVVSRPAQWAQDKFATPTQSGTSTSETVGLQRDPAGNFHLAVQGRFLASDNADRVYAGVSTSTDGGTTWSEFNIFPQSAINAYASANGMVPDSSYFGFSASDFVVTGNREFSLVMNIFESGLDSAGESTTIKAHIVEVYFENGTWAIRKIADASGLVLAYLPDPTTGDEVTNQMGNEIQVSRTADGTKLVAKWVEFYNFTTTGGETITGGDVTMAVRSLDSTNWSRPLNVTQDVFYNRTTWMPNIVPNDLKNIVILSTETILDGTETTIEQIQEKNRQLVVPQHVVIRAVDPVFVFGPEGGTGINNDVVGNLKMSGVSPNPVQDMAQFSYTLETEGQVSIEVVNIMGQKVMTLDNGFKNLGEHRVSFSTVELPAGTYYYTLKHNGGSITRMMTIVR